MKSFRWALAAAFVAAASGCGIVYTDIRVPRMYRSAVPSEVKASAADRVATGEACDYSLLYLVAWGDGGYDAAARKALGDETQSILYDVKADIHATGVLLGLYTRTCTVITAKVAKP